MTKEISIVEKDVVRAIEWAATEYKFILELKDELNIIRKNDNISKELKDIHHALSGVHSKSFGN